VSLLLGLAACQHGGAALDALAQPPYRVEYREHRVLGPVDLGSARVAQTWDGPETLEGRQVYTVQEVELDEGASVRARYRVFYGPEGFGYLGTYASSGEFLAYDPPEVVLPPDPRVGTAWSASHTHGDRAKVRTCEIMASTLCPPGLVVVCETQEEGARTIFRDHFCPGEGWVGFEAMQIRDDVASRMWSDELVRVPAP
jgi:hypothetical protein